MIVVKESAISFGGYLVVLSTMHMEQIRHHEMTVKDRLQTYQYAGTVPTR